MPTDRCRWYSFAPFTAGNVPRRAHHEGEVKFYALPRLTTEEVAGVLDDAARGMTRYLERRGLLVQEGDEDAGTPMSRVRADVLFTRR